MIFITLLFTKNVYNVIIALRHLGNCIGNGNISLCVCVCVCFPIHLQRGELRNDSQNYSQQKNLNFVEANVPSCTTVSIEEL